MKSKCFIRKNLFVPVNILFLLLFNSCNKNILTETNFFAEKTEFINLVGWEKADIFSSKPALLRSCNVILGYENNKILKIANVKINTKKYKKYCFLIKGAQNNKELKLTLQKYFYPILLKSTKTSKAHYTAYVELEVKGSLEKENNNYVPIYSMPSLKEDKNFIPSRKAIDNSEIYKEYILAYIEDSVKAYFLHIQGSGRLRLPDGSIKLIGYNGDNGREYVSIGKILVDKGYIKKEKISMHSIQEWMYNNPKESKIIREMNERYIFFKFRAGKTPTGASGVELTSFHSAAVDNNFLPYHTIFWVGNLFDNGFIEKGGLFVAQDAGAAIKGPLRLDLYLGFGENAEITAGRLSKKNRLWALLPKD